MSIQDDIGDIKINNEVVVKIASLAAMEVEGVVSLSGATSVAERFARRGRDAEKGFSVEIEENKAIINAEVNVAYGVDIYRVAHQLQVAIKNAVESMTGLLVSRVNVSIRDILLGDQPPRTGFSRPGEVTSIADSP